MSRFDENTRIVPMHLAATELDLRKPPHEPPTEARGIVNGTLLGVIAWAALIMLGLWV
jgi:hypothetical protein